jgi:crossover junction endodeoxyribonuclease RuvC
MTILGVDPGLEITGYGVIEVNGRLIKLKEAGIIKTSHKQKLQDRLIEIYDNLTEVIKETLPDAAVIEKLYSHYKHPVTSILMGHVRGVVYLAIKKNNISLFECPAKAVKKSITGNGNASKEQVARMVQAHLGLKETPSPVDISDALALAITRAFKSTGTPCYGK